VTFAGQEVTLVSAVDEFMERCYSETSNQHAWLTANSSGVFALCRRLPLATLDVPAFCFKLQLSEQTDEV
jgi:hypothetical protein